MTITLYTPDHIETWLKAKTFQIQLGEHETIYKHWLNLVDSKGLRHIYPLVAATTRVEVGD